MNERFGNMLRELREANDIGSRELARLAGLHESSVNHYEMGRQIPRDEAMQAIATVLCIPCEILSWFAHVVPDEDESNRSLFDLVDKMMLRHFERHVLVVGRR